MRVIHDLPYRPKKGPLCNNRDDPKPNTRTKQGGSFGSSFSTNEPETKRQPLFLIDRDLEIGTHQALLLLICSSQCLSCSCLWEHRLSLPSSPLSPLSLLPSPQ